MSEERKHQCLYCGGWYTGERCPCPRSQHDLAAVSPPQQVAERECLGCAAAHAGYAIFNDKHDERCKAESGQVSDRLSAGDAPNANLEHEGSKSIRPLDALYGPTTLQAAETAREIVDGWYRDIILAGVEGSSTFGQVVRDLPGLEDRITEFGERRYQEGVEAAAKVAEAISANAYARCQDLSGDKSTAALVMQVEQDTADILAKRIRALVTAKEPTTT